MYKSHKEVRGWYKWNRKAKENQHQWWKRIRRKNRISSPLPELDIRKIFSLVSMFWDTAIRSCHDNVRIFKLPSVWEKTTSMVRQIYACLWLFIRSFLGSLWEDIMYEFSWLQNYWNIDFLLKPRTTFWTVNTMALLFYNNDMSIEK